MTANLNISMKPLQKSIALLLIGALAACSNMPSQDKSSAEPQKPKNVILMVGDGMGFAYLKAYRLFKDKAETPEIDQTLFDQLLTGAVSTDANDAVGKVTDSAAAATTYATGFKTKNGAVGVDIHDQVLETALEVASKNNRSTGLVSTSRVVHATPAAFIAHVPSRRQYNDIADFFYDNQLNGAPQVDVILGGGTEYFKRKDRDLIAEFEQSGYQHLETLNDVKTTKHDKLLGLFAPQDLPAMWEREATTPSLADMTQLALDTLNRDENGFFLMVEGSQIDWGGHTNDILYSLSEMEDFEAALTTVLAFIDNNPDTLLIVTADHETGGLSIGADGNYGWDVDLLRNIHATPKSLALILKDSDEPLKKFAELTNIEMSEEEQTKLLAALNEERGPIDVIRNIISRASFTGWTSGGHTGVDVPLMTTGAGSEKFKGLIDNTDIGKAMLELNKQ
jgi:alkaline phosphatase